ncbi:MAG TPA: 4-carboxymuconolactone decarboxylase [Candidatus Binatia bacterium]|nr:4-carboxymuconolactone decarboxylase [Candidatus Binatia bacterium]
MSDDLFDKGMATRKAVLGADYVARAEANKTEFDADWQRYVTEHAWAAVWARPGLDKKIRSMLTIAMLAALGKHEELALHVRASRNTGVTQDEVKEVLLQVAVYAGAPAANSAFAIAKGVYKELAAEAK